MSANRLSEIMPVIHWWAERNIEPDDDVAVITDPKVNQSVVQAFAAGATTVGAEVVFITIQPPTHPGQELPTIVTEALDGATAVIQCTSRSISHTETINEFYEAGGKKFGISSGIDTFSEGLIEVYQTEPDFEIMRDRCVTFAELLSDADRVRIETNAGTAIEGSVTGRFGIPCTGVATEEKHSTGFPTGEVHLPPVQGETNGLVVIDTSMGGVGSIDTPIEIEVSDGYAVDIRGGREAETLQALLESHDRSARNFAEFGFGMNHFGRLTGSVNRDKKCLGTAHIALGDNHLRPYELGFDGRVISDVHLDGVLRDVTVYLDGDRVIHRSELQF